LQPYMPTPMPYVALALVNFLTGRAASVNNLRVM
jgi:hypothetical protein